MDVADSGLFMTTGIFLPYFLKLWGVIVIKSEKAKQQSIWARSHLA